MRDININMLKFAPKKVVFFVLALVISFSLSATVIGISPTNSNFKSNSDINPTNCHFTILHTNDIHAHDEPFYEYGRTIGGLARLGHLIRKFKNSDPTAIVVDAGDIFQGTPIYTQYHGETEVSLLNRIGYDIFTIGNHEFDDGPANLLKQLQSAQFDIISCNLNLENIPKLKSLVKPSVIKTICGQKVIFIGAITPNLEEIALHLNGVRVKSHGQAWMDPIKEQVKQALRANINKIVVVSHCGLDLDRKLAEAIPNIDVIIGGHSHTHLNQPVIVTHSDATETIITQAGCYGRNLGELNLAFDTNGRLIDKETCYRLIPIKQAIPEESDLKQYIADKEKPLLPLQNKIVGFAKKTFDNRFINLSWDSSIGNLLCDALAEAGEQYDAQISFQNRGGIRARIERGPITQQKVEEVLPFDDQPVIATVSGLCLLKALEHTFARSTGRSFLDVHGIKVAYDPSKSNGHHVVFALAQQQNGEYKPILPNKQYKIITSNYIFKSGEGYNFFKAQNVQFLPYRLSSILSSYLLKHQKITPQAPSRIIPLTDELLEIKRQSSGVCIHVKGTMAGSKLTFVVGENIGIEPEFLDLPIPVPLSHPSVLATDIFSGSEGKYTNSLYGLDNNNNLPKIFSRRGTNQPLYLCVIAQPPLKAKERKIMISYPIPIN